jgi:WD40 repeat protein
VDDTIRLWDVKTGKELGQLLGFSGYPRCVAFSPDGKRLLTGQTGNKGTELVCLWDVESRKRLRGFSLPGAGVAGMAFTPDGKRGIWAGVEGTIHVCDLESGKELCKMDHKGAVNDLALSPDGKRALTAGVSDHLVKLWDVTSGRLVYSFEGHVSGVLGVAFSPDGRQALSCDKICCVRLWKLGKK